MDGVKFGQQNLKSIAMDGVKYGKLKNYKSDEKMLNQGEERLCRSILKGLARRNHEKHTLLADVEEKQEQEQDVVCIDDVTGKELPRHAVRKARELELKYLRDLGVYEKIVEKEAVEKYGVTPIDTKWIDTDKAFEWEPMQIRSRICAREFKSDDRPDLYAGTPSIGGIEGHYIDRSEPQGNLLDYAHRCFTRVFPCEGSETSADTTPIGGPAGH